MEMNCWMEILHIFHDFNGTESCNGNFWQRRVYTHWSIALQYTDFAEFERVDPANLLKAFNT